MNKSYSPYLESTTKRSFDIIICLILLLPATLTLMIILPVVLLVDGLPVLFFQWRAGKGGRKFLMPKIRTLRNYAHPNKPTCSYDIDAFTTKTGLFLRKHRIDELPQIFSVLSGKMSLVGPRPELSYMIENYTVKELKRLYVKPGLTGLWQIKAPRSQPIHENIRYDLCYLRKASLWFDIKILAGTIPFVLKIKPKTFYEKDRVYISNLSVSN